MTCASRFGFLNKGRTVVSFRESGIVSERRYSLTISAITGMRFSIAGLKNFTGMGSRVHALIGAPLIVSAMSATETGTNLLRLAAQ